MSEIQPPVIPITDIPVDSVSNTDGSITATPIVGNVKVSLAVANPNTWTATQTFSAGSGPNTGLASTTGAYFTVYGVTISAGNNGALRIYNAAGTFLYAIHPQAITATETLWLPLITGTDYLAALGVAQTWTGTQTFIEIDCNLIRAVNGNNFLDGYLNLHLNTSSPADWEIFTNVYPNELLTFIIDNASSCAGFYIDGTSPTNPSLDPNVVQYLHIKAANGGVDNWIPLYQ